MIEIILFGLGCAVIGGLVIFAILYYLSGNP